MTKHTELTSEIFENFLAIFSSNRDEAGVSYEKLREGLIRFFYFRGCADGEALADETINRVAARLDLYDPVRAPRIASYVYGFATKVLLESRRQQIKTTQLDEEGRIASEVASDNDDNSDREECLRKCLAKRDRLDMALIMDYYAASGPERKKVRQELSKKNGLTAGALHTKIFRVKVDLRKCVEKCLSMRKISHIK